MAAELAREIINQANPYSSFVSRDVLQKRRNQQAVHIVAAMCVVFLFVFFLEQRKLSHYAMIESPIRWTTYMVGEQIMAGLDPGGNNGKMDFKEAVQRNAQVEPGGDPITKEELANNTLVGDQAPPPSKVDFALVHGN